MKKLTQQYFIIPVESEFARSRREHQRNQAQLMEAFAEFAALAGLESRNAQINMYMKNHIALKAQSSQQAHSGNLKVYVQIRLLERGKVSRIPHSGYRLTKHISSRSDAESGGATYDGSCNGN